MDRAELWAKIKAKESYLCVGLDPDREQLPAVLRNDPDALLVFNAEIIAATRDLCVAYKLNLAFYEALGPKGWQVVEKTLALIGNEHFLIADAKRGDIGNTSRLYAQTFFETFSFDAVTVAPYMGRDSVEPFLAFSNKWVIVLGLTSNSGSADFQLLPLVDGSQLYERVIQVVQTWGNPDNLMFVVGATHPDMFVGIRALVPEHFLLVPGVGAQGGDLAAISRAGSQALGGLLVNSSRAILYAGKGPDFAEQARQAAATLQAEMAQLLAEKKGPKS